MSNILVTGGSGYIGSVLVRKLLEKKHTVRIYDNLTFGDKTLPKDIDLIKGDIRKFLTSALDGIDAVIHLAALSNDPTADNDPHMNYDVNLLGTLKVAQACKQMGIKRFIHASSASVYHSSKPVKEIMEEDTDICPIGHYAMSKYLAEEVLLNMNGDSFCPIILRQGTVYGASPRMRYDLVVNTMIRDVALKNEITIYDGGRESRPLIDVRDVVNAYELLLDTPIENIKGQIFNLSGGNFTIAEVANMIAYRDTRITNRDKKGLIRSYKISTGKIRNIIGFKPRYDISEAVYDLRKLFHKEKFIDFDNPIYYNIQWMEKFQ